VGFISILGESGCGKSTLLNILTLVDSPTKGKVFYKDKDLSKLNETDKKRFQNNEIGILFQHFNLFDELTCLDNVIIPLLINGFNKKDAINKAKELFKEYKLDYLINQIYKTLSGGEKQRVALLRCLINNPNVIIADEPTGALDSFNSELIMNELKKLSKDHLVIVVSHNESLIKQYEDKRITIKDGHVSSLNESSDNKVYIKSKKKLFNKSALSIFLKLHLKKHKARNIITFASISFSLTCLLVSFGYLKGSKESINSYKTQSLLYPTATISKKIIVDVPDSPIKISKLTRPKLDEIDFINQNISSARIENNYSNIFSNTPTFAFDSKEVNDVECSPIYNFNNYKNLLVSGNFPNNDFYGVVVNEEFVRKFNYSSNDIVGRTIKLSYTTNITTNIEGYSITKDEVIFNDEFKIVGVVKEFAYLNSPRFYYSYLGLKNRLSNTKLENCSEELGYDVSVEDIVDYAGSNDPNSSYSYSLFIDDIEEVSKLFALKEKYDSLGSFDINSTSYTISKSYSDMTGIISTSLIVFIILSIIGAVSINIITSYSNFTSNKKESAILSILGTNRFTVFNIYNIENILIGGAAFLFSLLIAKPIELLVNKIIELNFNLTSLISINFISFIPLLIFIGVIAISVISSMIPFMFYENGFIVEELKDE